MFLCYVFLIRHKRRLIPESELGLALLHLSLEKYCNPSIDEGVCVDKGWLCVLVNCGFWLLLLLLLLQLSAYFIGTLTFFSQISCD